MINECLLIIASSSAAVFKIMILSFEDPNFLHGASIRDQSRPYIMEVPPFHAGHLDE